MSKPAMPPVHRVEWSQFSDVSVSARPAAIRECRALTETILAGLDLEREIRSVAEHSLGDTVLVHDGGELAGFAVCHRGAGTEAGSDTCYVKFGAARPDRDAATRFQRLLDACEAFALAAGARTIVAGVNMARHEAYRIMIERRFRTFLQGVAMQRPNEAAFHRPGIYVVDDWR
jgi:hypothetical protein